MKILILEDSKERIKTFKKKLSKHDLYFYDKVEDAKEAVNLIGGFDFYFIDHDLDDRVYVNSEEENTGYQFAKFLAEKEIEAVFITHTLNPVGANNICGVLPTCLRIPFINLFK